MTPEYQYEIMINRPQATRAIIENLLHMGIIEKGELPIAEDEIAALTAHELLGVLIDVHNQREQFEIAQQAIDVEATINEIEQILNTKEK